MDDRFRVRALPEAEIPAYVALRREMLLDTPWAFLASPGDDVGSDPVQLGERLRQPQNRIFVAESVDAPGVFLSAAGLIRQSRPKVVHRAGIWGVYTSPVARGKGLARAVMEASIACARGWDGVRRIGLSVSDRGNAAQHLYASLGFVEWGVEPDALWVDGEFMDERYLDLEL